MRLEAAREGLEKTRLTRAAPSQGFPRGLCYVVWPLLLLNLPPSFLTPYFISAGSLGEHHQLDCVFAQSSCAAPPTFARAPFADHSASAFCSPDPRLVRWNRKEREWRMDRRRGAGRQRASSFHARGRVSSIRAARTDGR